MWNTDILHNGIFRFTYESNRRLIVNVQRPAERQFDEDSGTQGSCRKMWYFYTFNVVVKIQVQDAKVCRPTVINAPLSRSVISE